MKRRLPLLLALAAAAVITNVPAFATTPPGSRTLGTAQAFGNRYVGWQVHVAEQAYFQVNGFGAAGAAAPIFFIRLDAPRIGVGRAGQPLAMAGVVGVGTSVPSPMVDQSGSELPPGDYAIVATASGGAVSAGRFVLLGPPSATITRTLEGPTFAFSDADFGGGPALVAPGVDVRSNVHGTVTVEVEHTLFAVWTRCNGSTHSLQGAPGAEGWPWATGAGVLWGQPGRWDFTLDAQTNRIEPGLGAPCTNDLVGFDLPVPPSAIPQR